MATNSNPPPDYLLGEMAATVRSIDANVTAIRDEIGSLTKRLGDVEQDLATIKAEHRAVQPEYQAFVKTVREHMSETNGWKSRFDGGVGMAKGGGKVLHIILAALFSIALFIAGQVWANQRLINDVRVGQAQLPH